MRIAVALVVAVATASAVVSGCGEGDAEPVGASVSERVTREFGRVLVSAEEQVPLKGHRTVWELLRGYHQADLSAGGRLVDTIDGARRQEGWMDENGWALFVNGIELDAEPRRYRLHPGDIVQWDLRDWHGALGVRATVGAFPAPFTGALDGKQLSTRVRCEDPASAACRRVKRTLRAAGVAIDGSIPQAGLARRQHPRRGEILVGRWSHWRHWRHWRHQRWQRRIEEGAGGSGIFARFTASAGALRLFDWNDRLMRTERAGTGLIGAMRPSEEDLVWLVTGVDRQGVLRAAGAFNTRDLRDSYAVAVTRKGVQKLPLPPADPQRAKPPIAATLDRLRIDITPYEKPVSKEPRPKLPTGPPPTRLNIHDLKLGEGSPVEEGDVVVVNYVGYIYATQRKYDTSYSDVDPIPLLVAPGRSNYVAGFEEGIVGMREGGERLVTMPSRKAYGKEGYSNIVPPNQALVFHITLEEAHHY